MVTIKGGEKLEAALRNLAKKVSQKTTAQVGFFETATYPDGTPVALIAAIQNFGAPSRGIPPRPFFTDVVKRGETRWPKVVAANLKATDYDVHRTLERVAMGIQGEVQQSIIDTSSPPLSPITIMLRGMRANDPDLVVTGKTVGIAARRVAEGKTNYGASAKPLVDRGILLQSVSYRVISG